MNEWMNGHLLHDHNKWLIQIIKYKNSHANGKLKEQASANIKRTHFKLFSKHSLLIITVQKIQ